MIGLTKGDIGEAMGMDIGEANRAFGEIDRSTRLTILKMALQQHNPKLCRCIETK